MGETAKEALKLQFDKRLQLEFHGARTTSDGGLLACRELDGALELTEVAPTYLRETRGGRNVQHELVPLLRQSVYSRLAGYEDTNDALRLARDPAMQAVVGLRSLKKLVSPYLEIEESMGISFMWGAPNWDSITSSMPKKLAFFLLKTLDRIAQRCPRLSDVILITCRPKRIGSHG